MTTTAPPAPTRPPATRWGLTAWIRNTWRVLTSMRTALVLLFLLALAALPGALLPQYSLNPEQVDAYFERYPNLAPILGRLGFFEVFAAPWFAAIYLLLMVSLIGCIVPRTIELARGVSAAPGAVPRRLGHLPHHAVATVDEPVDAVLQRIRGRLTGWRRAEAEEADGVRTVSAERGYLREIGNLVFHLSLVGLLIGFAAGKLYGYEGQVVVMSGGGQFCNTGILGYDSFDPGLRIDGSELEPFCLRVDDFDADYLPTGQAEEFRAQLSYQTAADLEAGVDTWRSYQLMVNQPLRIDGVRVYLLGHGYAPRFTVTFPDGQQRTGEIQWRPVDRATLLSEGATKFEPPGITDPEQRRTSQLAITGLLAPTTSGGDLVTSVFPEPLDPEVAIDVLRGDLGIDDGRGQSIFTVDQSKIESGELVRVARANLVPGEQIILDDGTVVRFDGLRDWVYLQVSHDPGQFAVLVFALLAMAGLAASLGIRRRRFFARLTPSPGPDGSTRTVVELGGLARTDRAGYGAEFDRLQADLLSSTPEDHR